MNSFFSAYNKIPHTQIAEIICISDDEYKMLDVDYCFVDTPFGRWIVASTFCGIAYLGCTNTHSEGIHELKRRFPFAKFTKKETQYAEKVEKLFTQNWVFDNKLSLHLRGTDFQMKVWKALLEIPLGCVVTYSDIAKKIEHAKAARAVGTAVGSNPVLFLIPCHRVIAANGKLGGFYWGLNLKIALLEAENLRSISA